jgi:hypothetical protein
VAYAFLMSLNRLGAGNPKGVSLAQATWNGEEEPLLVVDAYRVPMGHRPIVSPAITENKEAIARFIKLAGHVTRTVDDVFTRSTGNAALEKLQRAAVRFESMHLRK